MIDKKIPGTSFTTRSRIILIAAALVFGFAVSAEALELRFDSIGRTGDSLKIRFSSIDYGSDKLNEQIDKGIPVGIEYRLELWKVRPGWFDSQVSAIDISYRIRYDTWSKEYTVVKLDPEVIVEYSLRERREVFDLVMSDNRISLHCDGDSDKYYLTGKLTVKIMTLSNFKEVESWLKGEISDAEKPNLRETTDKVGEFLFNTALKITGLENRSKSVKSGLFELVDLPLRFSAEPADTEISTDK